VHAFVKAGIAVALGDDNPENTGVRLSEEVRLLVTKGDLKAEAVAGFARHAINAAFCSDAVRRDLAALLDHEAT
jgi:adenosine deaminase